MTKTLAKIKIKESKEGILSLSNKSSMTGAQQACAVEALRDLADELESQLQEKDDIVERILEKISRNK